MLMAAPEEYTFRCLIGNILDDLLLVDGIVQFTRQMDKLEEQIVDIEVKSPVISFFSLKLTVKLFHAGFYRNRIVLYDRIGDLVYCVFTENDASV